MKKLVAILLLSFTLPLCAMEETMEAAAEYHSDGSGSGSDGDGDVITGISGMTPSPARPQGLRMSGSSHLDPQELFRDDEVEPTDPVLAAVSKVLDAAAAVVKGVAPVTVAVDPSPSPAASPAPATVDPTSEEGGVIEALDGQVSPQGEGLGGGGSASPRVPVENSSVSHRWYSPKSPVLRIVAPTSLAAIIVGGYLTRRHVEKQRALGKPTVFDRMGQWVQRRYRRLAHNKKTTSETNA